MRNQQLVSVLLVCATAIAISAILSHAGPMQPPEGPIESTGHSLDDIYFAARNSVRPFGHARADTMALLFVPGITGDETRPGLEEGIRLFGLGLDNRNALSNCLSGVTMVIERGRATPHLWASRGSTNALTGAEIRLYRKANSTSPEHYFTITLNSGWWFSQLGDTTMPAGYTISSLLTGEGPVDADTFVATRINQSTPIQLTMLSVPDGASQTFSQQ